MPGFAGFPWASSPWAVPVAAPFLPGGTVASCRKVTGGDYSLTADGTYVDAPNAVDQEVQFRVAEILGTFADRTVGNGLVRVRYATAQGVNDSISACETALAPMVTAGTIAKLTATAEFVNNNGSQVDYVVVSYAKTGIVE